MGTVTDVEPLPSHISDLVHRLASTPGVVAVTLGGSRATGEALSTSDWDIGVHYRGRIDLDGLASLGEVHPPGSWGRIMNGGAWLTLQGTRVDVLLRDLDVVEHWSRRAEYGEFEVDGLLGYLAGIPTYSLTAEWALGLPLAGDLPPAPRFPSALISSAPPRWRFHARFSLDHASSRAGRGDLTGTTGLVARAALETAHAILCGRGVWVLNEKGLVERSGLEAMHRHLRAVPATGLAGWVVEAGRLLDAAGS